VWSCSGLTQLRRACLSVSQQLCATAAQTRQ
jgi:hypothetical protein